MLSNTGTGVPRAIAACERIANVNIVGGEGSCWEVGCEKSVGDGGGERESRSGMVGEEG
jgi:hypothetical protein